MELLAEDGQHIHARHRFASEQSGDVVGADLNTRGFFRGEGAGLVRRLRQHGGEAEKLAVPGLIDDDLLLILVNGRNLHRARQQNVGVLAGIANLVDALPRSEDFEIDLRGQHGSFIIVE